LTTVAILSAAENAYAQEPAKTPAQATQGVGGRATRPPTSYTGMNVSGRPQIIAGGAFRWADYPAVHTVDAASPAARVGIRPGDVILAINGADARDPNTLLGEAGQVLVVRVRRGTGVREFTFTRLPVSQRAAMRTGG
jgi:S1-C subfamily serine protease